jgi:hypothetical protein
MKYSVHSCVKLAELIFRIDGAPFSSRHAEPTVLNEDTEVEVLHGPLRVESPQGEPLEVVLVRFTGDCGNPRYGWIPYSYVHESRP